MKRAHAIRPESIPIMPPKLILHIGHHKTGSSSIQEALAKGSIALAGHRIIYPCKVSHNYLRAHVEAHTKGQKAPPDQPGRPGLMEIGRQIGESGADYAVISGEEFEGLGAKEVRAALSDCVLPHVSDHLVLGYVRPHAARVLSSFVENVKIGQVLDTPDRFHHRTYKRGRFIYAPRLADWHMQFGSRLRLRAMLRDTLKHGSVLDDFVLQSFGADAQGASLPNSAVANESLCIEDLMVLKIVQKQVRHRGKALSIMLGWEVARLLNAGETRRQRTKPALHKALAEEIRRDYLEDARNLDHGLFADTPVFERELDRAVDTALPEAQSWRPRDHFCHDAIIGIQAMARLVDEMLDNNKGNWPAYLRETRYAAMLSEGRTA
ncbi:hypothetical protein NHG85_00405 [Limimaricola sp. ASW11-118]|uniref:Uncharacterized protein n=1 Tax=Limimaricola litoreus TaxID=2955316 RepID=A0A9X2FM51_9RHOB|nr:hypothetical protein [Limimaricola litoreus]MCP1166999.1 hypothetical protein [Limimaricola litoreus]